MYRMSVRTAQEKLRPAGHRRCGGQLLMADVGLSQAIAGEMAVLQCSQGKMDVMYGNGRVERV